MQTIWKINGAMLKEAVMDNLIDAIVNNDLNAIEQLLRNGADINKKYEYDYTPLHVAVQENNIDIVKYFRAE